MGTSNLTAALHLVLDDKIAPGLKAMSKQLDGLRDAGKQIGLGKLTSGLDELRRGIGAAQNMRDVIAAIGNQAQRSGRQIKAMAQDLAFAAKYHATLGMQALRDKGSGLRKRIGDAGDKIGVVGGAIAGYSVVEPVRKFAAQEDILRHIAITKGLSGNAAEAEIVRLNKLINEDALKSGQSNRAVAEAYLDLQGQGISTSVIDKIIGQHSLAATAYGISPEVLGPAVGALIQSFKVPEAEIGSTLAAMAGASKQGRFKIGDFATQLPGVAASFSSAGIKGREGAIMSFSALETVMKNVGEPGQAATSLNEVMSTIFSPFAERFFAKKDIDLRGMLVAAEKQGVDPLTAVLGKLDALTKGKTDVEKKQILGDLIHDATARAALVALLQHKQDYLDMRKNLGGATQATLVGDFSTEAAGPEFQMMQLGVRSEILTQELGKTLLPVLRLLNAGLGHMTNALIWLNEHMPKTTMIVGSIAGGFVLLAGALGVMSTIWPAVSAGFSLASMPLKLLWKGLAFVTEGVAAFLGISTGVLVVIAAVAAVLVAAAVDIYEHWGRFKGFFVDLWNGLADIFGGVTEYLHGLLTLNFAEMAEGIQRTWHGLEEFFSGSWGIIKQLFIDFTDWVDSWTGGAMSAGIERIKSAWGSVKGFFIDLWHDVTAPFDAWIERMNAMLDRLKLSNGGPANLGVDPGAPLFAVGDGTFMPIGAPAAQVHIKVAAEPGSTAQADSPDRNVSVTHSSPLSPGRVLGRP